jgi:hypothetical protein
MLYLTHHTSAISSSDAILRALSKQFKDISYCEE